MKLLFAVIFMSFTSVFLSEKTNPIVGKWKAVDVRDQNGPCENFTAGSKLELEVYKDHTYKLSSNDKAIVHVETGTWKFDTIERQPTLGLTALNVANNDYTYKDIVNRGYPVLSLSKDSLHLAYNFCCNLDTCSWASGWVRFVKEK